MNPQDLEKLIQAITEEMLAYLGTQPANARPTELSEIYCAECNERCNHLCIHKTQKAIEAGADRISASSEVAASSTFVPADIETTSKSLGSDSTTLKVWRPMEPVEPRMASFRVIFRSRLRLQPS